VAAEIELPEDLREQVARLVEAGHRLPVVGQRAPASTPLFFNAGAP
jgi:hypothetical protein